MKFFVVVLLWLPLLGSLQGSTLRPDNPVRAINTTLQTNFNGTYERKNPCTGTEMETSSYIASHELHHHTKGNWNDYTDMCSTIINNFLQTIANLIRFNHKQNGTFNFYLNTSISQKQDVSGKQESCESLPIIVIEATDCKLPLNSNCQGLRGKDVAQSDDMSQTLTNVTSSPQYMTTKCPVHSVSEKSEVEELNQSQSTPKVNFPTTLPSSLPLENRPRAEALSNTHPQDTQPVRPQAKYFKTSLTLTPEADPEKGTIQPRVQYMATNLVTPPMENVTAQLQENVKNPHSEVLPNQQIQETTPSVPPFNAPQTPNPKMASTSFNPLPIKEPNKLETGKLSFPEPQSAEPLVNNRHGPSGPAPIHRNPGPEFPTVPMQLHPQPTTTSSHDQDMNTMPFRPQHLDVISTSPSSNVGQTIPPRVPTEPNYSSANQDVSEIRRNGHALQLTQPPTEPTPLQQLQPQRPSDRPHVAMAPPVQDFPGEMSTPRSGNRNEPPAGPHRAIPSPISDHPTELHPNSFTASSLPAQIRTLPETLHPSKVPNTPVEQQPVAHANSLHTSTKTVEQKIVSTELKQSTPVPKSNAGPVTVLENNFSPPPELVLNKTPQQPPSTAFPEHPQPQTPIMGHFVKNDGGRQPNILNNRAVPLQNSQEAKPSQPQPQIFQTGTTSSRKELSQIVSKPPPLTTPMPFRSTPNSEQSAIETNMSRSSATAVTNYKNSGADNALPPQGMHEREHANFPAPLSEALRAPQGVSPNQPPVNNYPVTPTSPDNPNQVVNRAPTPSAGNDYPTTMPQRLSSNINSSQQFPNPSGADNRRSVVTTTVTQTTETHSESSQQKHPTPANPQVPHSIQKGPLSTGAHTFSESLVSTAPRHEHPPFAATPGNPTTSHQSFPGQPSVMSPHSIPQQSPEHPVVGNMIPPVSVPSLLKNPVSGIGAEQFSQAPTSPAGPAQTKSNTENPKTVQTFSEEHSQGKRTTNASLHPNLMTNRRNPPVQHPDIYTTATVSETKEATTISPQHARNQPPNNRPNQPFGITRPPAIGAPTTGMNPQEPRLNQMPNMNPNQPPVHSPQPPSQIHPPAQPFRESPHRFQQTHDSDSDLSMTQSTEPQRQLMAEEPVIINGREAQPKRFNQTPAPVTDLATAFTPSPESRMVQKTIIEETTKTTANVGRLQKSNTEVTSPGPHQNPVFNNQPPQPQTIHKEGVAPGESASELQPKLNNAIQRVDNITHEKVFNSFAPHNVAPTQHQFQNINGHNPIRNIPENPTLMAPGQPPVNPGQIPPHNGTPVVRHNHPESHPPHGGPVLFPPNAPPQPHENFPITPKQQDQPFPGRLGHAPLNPQQQLLIMNNQHHGQMVETFNRPNLPNGISVPHNLQGPHPFNGSHEQQEKPAAVESQTPPMNAAPKSESITTTTETTTTEKIEGPVKHFNGDIQPQQPQHSNFDRPGSKPVGHSGRPHVHQQPENPNQQIEHSQFDNRHPDFNQNFNHPHTNNMRMDGPRPQNFVANIQRPNSGDRMTKMDRAVPGSNFEHNTQRKEVELLSDSPGQSHPMINQPAHRFIPNGEAPVRPPTLPAPNSLPPAQEMPANPFLHAMESHFAPSTHQSPGSSSFPGHINHQAPGERNPPARHFVNTPVVPNRPQALVPDQTIPSNSPGEDHVSCCGRSTPLMCPFDPAFKGNMTAPSYYILVSKIPETDREEESFRVEKVFLGDGTPFNCSLPGNQTFPTSLYIPVPYTESGRVTLRTKSDFA